jgi:thiamine kinase-like enzyme
MEHIYAFLMSKNKNSNSNGQKYEILSCQKSIDSNKNTKKFIDLKEIIKDNKNNLKIFDAILFKTTKIVVKISTSDTILKEYQISHMLSDINGFIKYLCYFSCNNKIDKIISNSSICAAEGEPIKILLMKKYELGDIKNYNWNLDNFFILKILIKQIFIALLDAFNKYGFLHNDVHFGNFLIKKTNKEYQVIIMDFENSLFDCTKNNIYVLYYNYDQILGNIFNELYLETENMDIVLNYINPYKNKKNKNNNFDINYLLILIDNVTMTKKRDSAQKLIYNPNVI